MILETPLFITGLGLVGNFGDSPDALKTCISERRAPVVTAVANRYGSVPCMMADATGLKDHINPRLMRRMDKFSRMALYACSMACKHAMLPEGADDKPTALIVATGFGAIQTTFDFLDSLIESGDNYASPTRFTNSLHNTAASAISLMLKFHGPCSTITAFEHSFVNALFTAYSWIHEQRVSRVVLGTVDEVCPVLGYCFERYLGPTATVPVPHDLNRHSAVPGEGAAFFVLETGSPPQNAMARIDAIMNESTGKELPISTPTLFLGNDGNQMNNPAYTNTIRGTSSHIHSIGGIIGSFPTAQAFDLAAAAVNAFQDPTNEATCLRHNLDQSTSLIQITRM